jgi:ubiquinone/menaquinone biosynthesis C-methylase UbiE
VENEQIPRLYTDLFSWWQLLSEPLDYAEEARFYCKLISDKKVIPVKTMLELGSGGGNNASHLKVHFSMTLVDRSIGMLNVSRGLNPECEHLQGDMRSVRLGRLFDAIFIHDAISYMTTYNDLKCAIETAYVHCRSGGLALFYPDFTRETFTPHTGHGGHDSGERGLRYLEWTYNPNPADNTYIMDMVYLLREDKTVRCEYDRHIMGLFAQDEWLKLMSDVGFKPEAIPFVHSKVSFQTTVFVGMKPLL